MAMIGRMARQEQKQVWLVALVAILVGAVLFPYGWLGQRWELFDDLIDWLFATEGMHIVGHLLMYAGLGTAVLLIFPLLKQRPYHYFALILGIGLLQESLQLLTFKGRFFMANELFDLFTDLLGGGLVFAVSKIITQQWEKTDACKSSEKS